MDLPIQVVLALFAAVSVVLIAATGFLLLVALLVGFVLVIGIGIVYFAFKLHPVAGVFALVWVPLILAGLLLRLTDSRSSVRGGSGSGRAAPTHPSAPDTSERHEVEKSRSFWPVRRGFVVTPNAVIERDLVSATKVADIEDVSGSYEIYKGSLAEERIGRVETDVWGNPVRIIDREGRTVGIITGSLGELIIVDEDGNQIGEYHSE